jgi:hypothetical protein
VAVDRREEVTPSAIREQTGVAEPVPQVGTAGAPIRQSSLWKDAWHRYSRNKGALIAGVVFVLVVLY